MISTSRANICQLHAVADFSNFTMHISVNKCHFVSVQIYFLRHFKSAYCFTLCNLYIFYVKLQKAPSCIFYLHTWQKNIEYITDNVKDKTLLSNELNFMHLKETKTLYCYWYFICSKLKYFLNKLFMTYSSNMWLDTNRDFIS